MSDLLSFLAIVIVITIVPGPDFFIVVKNTVAYGKKGGIITVLGSTTAHIVYISLSVAGLIILLTNFYFVFQAIKILGIIYLVYLGISSIISGFKKDDINQLYTVNSNDNYKKYKLISYRQGFLSTLLNPKAILVYGSILPQFITNKSSASLQIALLSVILALLIITWLVCCVFIFGFIKKWFENSKVKATFDYIVGIILIGLSAELLFSKKL